MNAAVLAFLEGPDLIIVLIIVLVVFGSSQLPKLARSLGQAKRELDAGLREGAQDTPQAAAPPAAAPPAAAPPAAAPPAAAPPAAAPPNDPPAAPPTS